MSETLTNIMSSRRAMSEELRSVNDYLQIALDNMARGVSMFDGQQHLILCNKKYGETYDLPPALARTGTPLAKIIRFYNKRETGRDDEATVTAQLEWIRKEIAVLSRGELRTRTQILANGRTVRITTQPLSKGGWVDILEDITEQAERESKLEALAHRDRLTGIANLVKFQSEFEDALAKHGKGGDVVVHVVDMGCFQSVKERLGIAVRDTLVRELANVLVKWFSPPDCVARIDGDLFAALRAGTMCQEAALDTGRRLETALQPPFDVFGHSIESWARVVTVFAPRDGSDADQILRNAVQQRFKAVTGDAREVMLGP